MSNPTETLSDYKIQSVIATAASAQLNSSDTSFCDKVNFLYRQKLTNYFLFRGSAINDTTMDNDKIYSLNYKTSLVLVPGSYGPATIQNKLESEYGENTYVEYFLFKNRGDNLKFKEKMIKDILSCGDNGWIVEPSSDKTSYFIKGADSQNIMDIEYIGPKGITVIYF